MHWHISPWLSGVTTGGSNKFNQPAAHLWQVGAAWLPSLALLPQVVLSPQQRLPVQAEGSRGSGHRLWRVLLLVHLALLGLLQ